jgi:hypothetical protein
LLRAIENLSIHDPITALYDRILKSSTEIERPWKNQHLHWYHGKLFLKKGQKPVVAGYRGPGRASNRTGIWVCGALTDRQRLTKEIRLYPT